MPRTRNLRRTLLSLAAVAILAPVSANAAPWDAPGPWTDPGAFITIAGVNAFEHFQDAPEQFDNSWGFTARGGYRFNRWIAVEGFLEFLSGYDTSFTIPAQAPDIVDPTVKLTIDGGTGGANVKAYAPWFGRIQPYALAGVGGQWARLRTTYPTGYVCDPFLWYCGGVYTEFGSEGAFIAKFGGGTEFWVSEDMAVVVDAVFNLPTGDLKDLRSTSLSWGFMFRF